MHAISLGKACCQSDMPLVRLTCFVAVQWFDATVEAVIQGMVDDNGLRVCTLK
jgi:hypothetical protein